MTTSAILYLRQSLDRDGEGLAVERQRQDCRRLARDRGWKVVSERIDNDTSATARRRPGFEQLVADVEAGRADVIVAWHVDRLVRRLADLQPVIELCERTGTRIATVSGDVDLSTDAGRLVGRILASVAQGEVERKGTRQRRANLQRAQAGRPRFVQRPYGYSADGMRIVRVEGKWLRRAAEQVLAGASLRDTTAMLNAAGVATSSGGRWTATSLRRVLTNPRHAGHAVHRGEVVGTGAWPAILDPATHEALLARLSDPGRRTAPSTARKHLLSGILRCGACGEPMFGSPLRNGAGRTWPGYRCRQPHLARRRDLVDAFIEDVVIARLARADAVDLLVSPGPNAEELRARATALRRRLDDAVDLFATGTVTRTQMERISASVRQELAEVEAAQAQARSGNTLSDLVGTPNVAKRWAALPLSRKRAVITTLLDATLLPAGRGARFDPVRHLTIEWRGGAADFSPPRPELWGRQ